MISSPPPKEQAPEKQDEQKDVRSVRSTPARKRLGETPTARFAKGIFRPFLKGIYYTLRGIRTHKLITLSIILLTIASMIATSFLVTKQLPFGIGNDPFDFHIRGVNGNGGGEHIKDWLYALRDGDAIKMSLVQSGLIMSTPPDVAGLIGQFSQAKAGLKWNRVNVDGVFSQDDGTLDSYVSVNFTGPVPSGGVKGTIILHFTTLPAANGRLLFIHLVDVRQQLG